MILNNKNTNEIDFNIVRNIICDKYNIFKKEMIKAIFIKKLPIADIIPANKPENSPKTTHIACTTQSIHFFYPILGEVIFNNGPSDNNTFDIYVETQYLDINSDEEFVKSKCTIWKFSKSGGNQIGLSKKSFDGYEFYKLREKIYLNDVIIFFKYLNENNELNTYVMLLKNTASLDMNIINKIDNLTKPKYYEEVVENFDVDINPTLKGINKVYFGSPGTGKSKYVNDMYYSKFAKRVTFHSEYTYNDFVGYIRPIIKEDGGLSYKFIPGVFTEILIEALKNPNNMYSLIIEELNRANTSAVFGDIFQLLDRDSNGISEYKINHTEIYNCIKDELGECYKVENGVIYIPNNLNIIATMNTADQGVFVMDTAFKRRWEFEYLPIKFDDNHPFKDNIIDKLNITWETFVSVINEFMMSKENSNLMISEDKQIGPYFVKLDELNDCQKFGYKVLLYLWDDVFKMDRECIFNDNIRTFSDLIKRFLNGEGIDIFSLSINKKLKEHIIEDINTNKEAVLNV